MFVKLGRIQLTRCERMRPAIASITLLADESQLTSRVRNHIAYQLFHVYEIVLVEHTLQPLYRKTVSEYARPPRNLPESGEWSLHYVRNGLCAFESFVPSGLYIPISHPRSAERSCFEALGPVIPALSSGLKRQHGACDRLALIYGHLIAIA